MINIAIDGPAGAGKSTIAKAASKHFGFIYVDTGALYRAVSLKFTQVCDGNNYAEKVDEALCGTEVDIRFVDGEQHVFLNGEDVNSKIRTPEVSMAASAVSALPKVREFLLEKQRELARKNNVIMDGRDIGTVVLPDATLKVFLTASAESRAKRRHLELIEKGIQADFQTVLKEIVERDYNDSHREIAPLKQAVGAVLIDTTDYNLEESINIMINTISERCGI